MRLLPYPYVGYQPPLRVHHSGRKCWKYIYKFDVVANDYILVNDIRHTYVGDQLSLLIDANHTYVGDQSSN